MTGGLHACHLSVALETLQLEDPIADSTHRPVVLSASPKSETHESRCDRPKFNPSKSISVPFFHTEQVKAGAKRLGLKGRRPVTNGGALPKSFRELCFA